MEQSGSQTQQQAGEEDNGLATVHDHETQLNAWAFCAPLGGMYDKHDLHPTYPR